MQIHRNRHTRGFTILPNTLLQDRRLSYTARGLLADLLSRPDGWREDGRHMADSSPQGRLAVAKALRELTAFGYYRVERVRLADGTVTSQAHVYDTPYAAHAGHATAHAAPTGHPTADTPPPRRTAYGTAQVAPGTVFPGPGQPVTDERGAHPVKDRAKEPTLPAQRAPADAAPDAAPDTTPDAARDGRPGPPPTPPAPTHPPNTARIEAAALLHRVTAAEPRLRLGAAEAFALAPLVAPWLDRGLGQRDLAHVLLGGLPERVHSASALLRDRLTRKLPPAPEPAAAPPNPRWYECATCARPLPHEGICRICAGLDATPPDVAAGRARTAARGRARVRAALAPQPPRVPRPAVPRPTPATA